MPKNTNLKLFTKTWPLKRDKKDEERNRPLTATLEKPTILDIKFLGKIDMSLVRKEFLNITNLCRLPLVLKKKADFCKPLRLLNAETQNKKTKNKHKIFEPNEDSHEDDESSVIQSAKINSRTTKSNRSSASNKSVINFKRNNILAVKNDTNNNYKTSLKIPIRKPTLTTIATPNIDPVKSSLSTKLPSPCKTCGRPDLPERFHSHPTSERSNIGKVGKSTEVRKVENKIPTVKSSVQKPVAIKYQSRIAAKKSPIKKLPRTVVPITQKKPDLVARQTSPFSDREPTMSRKLVTPSRGGSAKRTLTCYICGREFGTASLSLHEPKCLQKWERENSSLPTNLRRKAPVKPQGDFTQTEWNQLAWESSQANLVPCKNCSRTFNPDRLEVHQRSCKTPPSNTINIKKSFPSNDALSTSSSMTQKGNSASTSLKSPQLMECYICGKKFGTKSVQIHEKQCLKKWHVENESLPRDMRSPAPTKQAKLNQMSISSCKEKSESVVSEKEERPTSGTKSPLFPCYLCGKLFTVNSIYIHEPQCLKMWKIENDKLPASKRRPVPLKPDVKFTPAGKLNFEETSEAYWKSHLNQLVPCKICSRTFNPDRVHVHERNCKGN